MMLSEVFSSSFFSCVLVCSWGKYTATYNMVVMIGVYSAPSRVGAACNLVILDISENIVATRIHRCHAHTYIQGLICAYNHMLRIHYITVICAYNDMWRIQDAMRIQRRYHALTTVCGAATIRMVPLQTAHIHVESQWQRVTPGGLLKYGSA